MSNEIELKLALPEAEQRKFLRSPLLRDALSRSSGRLINIYYDTPDLALNCNGIALRLRQSGRRWLQTVKCAGISQGGLSSRPEWEGPYTGEFDFSAIDDVRTRKQLERLKSRLVPVFETSFLRTTWTMRAADSQLLLVLDRGNISANGKVSAISEVEIELAYGKVDSIFVLAKQLATHFTLTPAPLSKAERGYRLFLGSKENPSRAIPVKLDMDMPPVMAFREIALSCLDHLQHNQSGAVGSSDAEYIHQMRVALRRLSAALRLFRPELPEHLGMQMLPPLHALMAVLGKARDLDVLTAEIVDPVVTAIPAEPRIAALAGIVAARRHAARLTAVGALKAPEYGLLLLSAMHELSKLTAADSTSQLRLNAFINTRLTRLQRKVLRLAEAARQDTPTSLHALRIGAKRLRYALEFFVPLLPAHRTATLLKQLARLQNTLGQLNDLANAGELLMACADDEPGLREAVALIGGWHAQNYAGLLAGVPVSVKKLQAARLPKAE